VGFSTFFFQLPAFIYRNADTEVVSFKNDSVSIFFSREGHQLISSSKSPFGSFNITEPIDKNKISDLTNHVLHYAKETGVGLIEIKCYPEVYSQEKSAVIFEVLTEIGFQIKYEDITQILYTDGTLGLSTLRKRKLKECFARGFVFNELDIQLLPEAYALFLQSRIDKGYPVTMRLEDFIDEFNKFPLNYKLYGVSDKGRLIAASVVISVDDEILYHFFPGDALSHRRYSPMTYLIYELCQVAKKNGFKFIDMGISTDKGILNRGLYNFKKSFGAVDSLKFTFEKKL
jgi:Acetyltransferase (GNAT) domain